MTDAHRARAADVMQLRAGHFPASFVAALEVFASVGDGAPGARRAAALDVRAWYVAGGLPAPRALELACGGAS